MRGYAGATREWLSEADHRTEHRVWLGLKHGGKVAVCSGKLGPALQRLAA
jgi:hypothetical protein